MKRALAGTAALAVLAALGLAAYAFVAEWRFFRQHAPPGRLVGLPGRRLHIRCAGAGTPTVVFESSLGGSSIDWYLVQPEVARFTRACAYDRAGAGWSDEAPLPRDPLRSAEELRALLAGAEITGPYVPVGHSYGGYIARVFAHRYAAETAGLVLVDAVTPEAFQRIPALEALWRDAVRGCRWDKLRATFAIPRLRGDTIPYVPEAIRPLADGFFLARKFQDPSCGEVAAMLGEGQAQVRAAGSFGDLPLGIVTAGQREFYDEPDWRTWQEIQRGLTELSRRSSQIVATHSTHHVQFGEPGAVVAAIQRVVDAARGSSPSR